MHLNGTTQGKFRSFDSWTHQKRRFYSTNGKVVWGPVVWIPGIPEKWKGLLLMGTPRIPNHQSTISWFIVFMKTLYIGPANCNEKHPCSTLYSRRLPPVFLLFKSEKAHWEAPTRHLSSGFFPCYFCQTKVWTKANHGLSEGFLGLNTRSEAPLMSFFNKSTLPNWYKQVAPGKRIAFSRLAKESSFWTHLFGGDVLLPANSTLPLNQRGLKKLLMTVFWRSKKREPSYYEILRAVAVAVLIN